VSPRPSDCEPGAVRSPASRPGRGSGARGTFRVELFLKCEEPLRRGSSPGSMTLGLSLSWSGPVRTGARGTYMGDSSLLGPSVRKQGSYPSTDRRWAASSARAALRLVAAWMRRMLTSLVLLVVRRSVGRCR
jgi:hypothetical protein